MSGRSGRHVRKARTTVRKVWTTVRKVRTTCPEGPDDMSGSSGRLSGRPGRHVRKVRTTVRKLRTTVRKARTTCPEGPDDCPEGPDDCPEAPDNCPEAPDNCPEGPDDWQEGPDDWQEDPDGSPVTAHEAAASAEDVPAGFSHDRKGGFGLGEQVAGAIPCRTRLRGGHAVRPEVVGVPRNVVAGSTLGARPSPAASPCSRPAGPVDPLIPRPCHRPLRDARVGTGKGCLGVAAARPMGCRMPSVAGREEPESVHSIGVARVGGGAWAAGALSPDWGACGRNPVSGCNRHERAR